MAKKEKKGLFSKLFNSNNNKKPKNNSKKEIIQGNKELKDVKINSKDNNNLIEDNIKKSGNKELKRPYLTKEESVSQYNSKEMEQNVFLFAPPNVILPVQKYINENFNGITCIGTSSIANIIEEYKRKLNSRQIILFIENTTSLKQLLEFLSLAISIKSSNPELLNIYIILAKGVDYSPLQSKEYAGFINIFQLSSDLTKISENSVNKILSRIVEQQPVYIKPEEKIETPKLAVKKNVLTVNEPFKTVNINELRERVAKAKLLKNTDQEDVLKDTVLNINSQKDVENLSDVIPELSVLKTYGEQLSEYMKSNKENLSPEQITELAVSQLELTAVQQETIKDIFAELVKSAEEAAETKDKNIRHSTMEDVNILADTKFSNDLDKDDDKIQETLVLREEIRQKAIQGFEGYKKEIKVISNAIEAQKQLIQGSQKQLMETIQENQEKLEPEVVKAADLQLVYMNDIKEDINKNKNALQVKMGNTLNYVSTVFKDYNVLISIDDVLIEKLVSDREKLKANNIKKVYTVENKLQLNSKLMIWNDVNALKDMLKTIIQPTTLVITSFEGIDYGQKVVSDAETFMEKDYSFLPNIVTIKKSVELDLLKSIINKMKYLASSYNKVLFLLDSSDKEYIDIVSKEVPEVVYVTGIGNSSTECANKELTSLRNTDSILSYTIIPYGYEEQIPYNELLIKLGAKNTDKIVIIKQIKDVNTAKNALILLRSV